MTNNAIKDKVMNGEFSPDMADIEEWVTSMGIPPVSCYAQRLNTELGEENERLRSSAGAARRSGSRRRSGARR